MTRIDRYILLLYLRVLAICFVSVTGLLIVVHIFSNLDEFVRFSEQTEQALVATLIDYYGPYTLTIFERLSGLMALLALLFVVAWLNKTNEFTALLAAGVTKRRVVRPLFAISMVVILGAAASREVLIPKYQDRLDRTPQDLTGDYPRRMKPTFDYRAVALLQGRHLLPLNSEIVSPILAIRGEPLASIYGSKVLAKSAVHQPAHGDRPAGYLFRQVSVPASIDTTESVMAVDGKPLLLTPKDNSWLESGNCFLVSDIEYEALRGGSAWKQFAATPELVERLRVENRHGGNELRVRIHQRILRPAMDWTVLLLGIPVLLSRPDRHMFWVAGACLFVVAAFTGVSMGLGAIGGSSNLVSPSVAAWLPLVIFLPWAWSKTQSAMDT